eukprot:508110-Pelagomonas_calceolata.AAC.5
MAHDTWACTAQGVMRKVRGQISGHVICKECAQVSGHVMHKVYAQVSRHVCDTQGVCTDE